MTKIITLFIILLSICSCNKLDSLESAPTVLTLDASDVKPNSFTISGDVINEGLNATNERGFVWSETNSSPSVSDNKVNVGYGKGLYSFTIEKLTANTTYYVKAYASNNKGTSYGETKSIKTSSLKSLSSGLIAFYLFNGNANDYSGNNLNGIISGATLTTNRYNTNNSAYYFDGKSNIEIKNSNQLNPSDITISVWYNSEIKNSTILAKSNHTNALDFSFKLTHEDEQGDPKGLLYSYGLGRCDSYDNAYERWGQKNLIKENVWNHLVFSVDKNGMGYVYINGSKIVSITDGIKYLPCNLPTSSLRIGGMHWLNDPEYFKGKIDDLGIWNRVLTPEEIKYLNENEYKP